MKNNASSINDESIARSTGLSIIAISLLLLALSLLSSCNTTRGFGRDVEKVGSKIEHAAARASGN
ncbi:entericidin A/B family lipoprotein [Prosthecobacter fluviatilis]|uniref:Entericidin A/B family lipoprotein n=1 Tax=Prosthecobacter fluviatilis TaxID=445931 RepID=A0ABW0KMU5_9BACT